MIIRKGSGTTTTTIATAAIIIASAMLITMTTTTNSTTAYGQTDDRRTYESEEFGFRLQIPQGWVIQDENLINSSNLFVTTSYEPIALLCLENEALPGIGGKYDCQSADLTHDIWINTVSDLQSRPEFENESSTSIITANNLLALWIQDQRNVTISPDIKIENNTDVDEFTKFVNMTYQYLDLGGTLLDFYDDYVVDVNSSMMFILSQDRNIGYSVVGTEANNNNQTQQLPALQEVFNSFELIR